MSETLTLPFRVEYNRRNVSEILPRNLYNTRCSARTFINSNKVYFVRTNRVSSWLIRLTLNVTVFLKILLRWPVRTEFTHVVVVLTRKFYFESLISKITQPLLNVVVDTLTAEFQQVRQSSRVLFIVQRVHVHSYYSHFSFTSSRWIEWYRKKGDPNFFLQLYWETVVPCVLRVRRHFIDTASQSVKYVDKYQSIIWRW